MDEQRKGINLIRKRVLGISAPKQRMVSIKEEFWGGSKWHHVLSVPFIQKALTNCQLIL